jgi:hypothetical protein
VEQSTSSSIRAHLRKTLKIALIVGCVLTAINQLDVFLRGNATAVTFVKTGLNFCVPFVVSNLGLLAGKRAEAEGTSAAQARTESGVLWSPEPPPE